MTMYLTPETLYPLVSALLFAVLVGMTLGGAIVVVCTSRLVRSVSGLALSSTGLAGLYYYLHSPFLALMQILIYVGAVCVTIMFALMLTDAHGEVSGQPRETIKTVAALLAGLPLAVGLILLIAKARWMPPAVQVNAGTVSDLGQALLTRFGLVFELISVVLLLSILGALVVARSGRRN